MKKLIINPSNSDVFHGLSDGDASFSPFPIGVYCAFLFCFATLGACAGDGPRPEFDANRVKSLIEAQVAFGPRVPETEAWRQCRTYLKNYFDSLGYQVELQEFTHKDYSQDRTVSMCNIIIKQPKSLSKTGPRILLGAHWDSRPRCENDPDPARRTDSLPGAVDGAAGVALLMELARMFANSPPDAPVEFVLFDGEDWGQPGDINQYIVGSNEFARRVSGADYQFAIVPDLFAHAGSSLAREGMSQRFAASINDRVWQAARELDITRFVDTVSREVIDDHLPLLNIGIKTIDIIDMNYPHWHTSHDTPDKCDSAAIADVGRVIARVVYQSR